MTRVKICGITNPRDALAAVRAGADALGFVFYPPSGRHIPPESAKPIIELLPPFVSSVGLFVDADSSDVLRIASELRLDYVQLHGRETPAFLDKLRALRIIKAFRIAGPEDVRKMAAYRADGYLLDAFAPGLQGGTGQTFDWSLLSEAPQVGPIILAGGLNPDNVAEAIQRTRPYAVDVSSGVEDAPGVKNRELMERFVYEAKNAI
ncbi:MAG TPA: phosphoribosylanthranilate isomerase [Candidatus Brocadiia bacterium]|nr:phosphoribosylanthranilate isomerase [Candidatus Brocadiia bacterium]